MRLVQAELLKLWRAWSTWILLAIPPVITLPAYLLVYLLTQVPQPPGEPDFAQPLLDALALDGTVGYVLGLVAGIAAPVALILAAMNAGREYGWRTIATLFTLRPRRPAVVAAKCAALAVVIAVMVVATFATGALAALAVNALAGNTGSFPPAGEVVAGIGVGWLIAASWAALGFALGFVLRSNGLAIGIGLVYALVVESVVSFLAVISEPFEAVSRALLGVNASALAGSFTRSAFDDPFLVGIDAPIAALVLGAYLVVSVAIALVVVARRDVT